MIAPADVRRLIQMAISLKLRNLCIVCSYGDKEWRHDFEKNTHFYLPRLADCNVAYRTKLLQITAIHRKETRKLRSDAIEQILELHDRT